MFSSLPRATTTIKKHSRDELSSNSKAYILYQCNTNFPMLQINQLCTNSPTFFPSFQATNQPLFFPLIKSNESWGFGNLYYKDIHEVLQLLYFCASLLLPLCIPATLVLFQIQGLPTYSQSSNYQSEKLHECCLPYLQCSQPNSVSIMAPILTWLILFIILELNDPPRAHNLNWSHPYGCNIAAVIFLHVTDPVCKEIFICLFVLTSLSLISVLCKSRENFCRVHQCILSN